MRAFLLIAVLAALCGPALGAERFPPPDFTDHKLPVTQTPPPRWNFLEYLDVAVLAAAMGAATFLALKVRSRLGVLLVMVASLLYLGLYREGCVCPIGAIQNVTLALFDPSYAVPWTVVAFFLLPLVVTLFFGRTFCAGVCPLGAIQDVVVMRPIKVPPWLQHCLGLLAWVYLGLAVLFAATSSAFVICEYDPFVSFFRLNGTWRMLVLGGCRLVIGMFVARPYCRFLCPYGALLRPLSRLAWWHARITPDKCVQCRLCEDSCPFGAIAAPNQDEMPLDRGEGKRALGGLIVLLPVLVALGGGLGRALATPLSRMHATVRLAEQVSLEDAGKLQCTTNPTDPAYVFRTTGRAKADLYQEAGALHGKFVVGSAVMGGFVGLVIGLKLIGLSLRRRRSDYEADRSICLSCGRCFSYCPVDREWRKRRGYSAQGPQPPPFWKQ